MLKNTIYLICELYFILHFSYKDVWFFPLKYQYLYEGQGNAEGGAAEGFHRRAKGGPGRAPTRKPRKHQADSSLDNMVEKIANEQ